MNLKKLLAMFLVVCMLLTILAACGDNGEAPAPPTDSNGGSTQPGNDNGDDNYGDGEDYEDAPPMFVQPSFTLPENVEPIARYTADGRRIIRIAMWWDSFYDSSHTSIDDDPGVTNPETAQMGLDRIRYVEEKYNVYIEKVNMTWEGITENIIVSILSGAPDADIYMVDTSWGIPAVLNGFAVSFQEMGFANDHPMLNDADDIITTLQIPGMDDTYLFQEAGYNGQMYLLGFNLDMLQEHGLEDPRDLWDRDEWTWEKFREYCIAVTNPAQNIYGYSGYWTNFLTSMLFTNDAAIAAGPIQTLDSPNTVEVLNFIHELYNVDKVARPWNVDDWEINNSLYAQGLSGFFLAIHWLLQSQSGEGGANLTFDLGVVPFPVGPQGDKYTMATMGADGNFYIVPRFIEDPRFVFDVFYDLTNWFDGDLEYRDDLEWEMDQYLTQRNFDIYLEVFGRLGFDLWSRLNTGFGLDSMLETNTGPPIYTPAQMVETYKQVFQDALDYYFG